MSNDLTINLRLDRTQAQRAAQQFHAQEKQRIGELLSDTEIAEQAKQKVISDTNKQRVTQAVAALKQEKQATQQVADANQELGTKGQESWKKISVGMALAKTGMEEALRLARGLGDAVDRAAQKAREYTNAFASQQDRLTELANLEGQRPDTAFVLNQARFSAAVGFTPEEGLGFRSELFNAGAQFKGRNISDKEFEQFAQQAGKYSVAKGLSPTLIGDLAGTVLGMRDRSKLGDQASESALGGLDTLIQTVQRGKGDTSELVRQISILGSKSFAEEETRGAFTDELQLGMFITTMAETGMTGSAAEHSMMALRGLRGFNRKEGKLLKKAGITPQDDPVAAIRKLAPVVEKMAKERGVKPGDITRQSFTDVGTAEAIDVLINKGVYGGIFEDREEQARQQGGPDAILGNIESLYGSDDQIQRRLATAGVNLAEQEQGAKFSKVDILRKQALQRLITEGKTTADLPAIQKFLAGQLTFGLLGDQEQRQIDMQARDLLTERFGNTEIGTEQSRSAFAVGTPNTRAEMLRSEAESIQAQGYNPLTGEAIQILKDIRDKLPNEKNAAPPALPSGRGPSVNGRVVF